MAIVSRSNKKQPVFDPSEIEDLIFSPAVGSGVGSHLIGQQDFPAPNEELSPTQSAMGVDSRHVSTVDMFRVRQSLTPRLESLLTDGQLPSNTPATPYRKPTTVVTSETPTVADTLPPENESAANTAAKALYSGTVVTFKPPTVDISPTVDNKGTIDKTTTVVATPSVRESDSDNHLITASLKTKPRHLTTVAISHKSTVDALDQGAASDKGVIDQISATREKQVASSTVETADKQPRLPTVATTNLSTVDNLLVEIADSQTTVAISHKSTVDTLDQGAASDKGVIDQISATREKQVAASTVETTDKQPRLPTVATTNLSTVDNLLVEIADSQQNVSVGEISTREELSARPDQPPVQTRAHHAERSSEKRIPPISRSRERAEENQSLAATVDTLNVTTVASDEIRHQKTLAVPILWITEQGDLVPQARVKRIRLAQDVINSAEESVYDTLWSAKAMTNGDRESFRIVQAGYDYLGKRTRLSKKTIQRIIAKLLDKDFITIEHPADIYERTATVYRVFNYKTVLDHHVKRGRSHVAKVGPGFSYVHPVDDPRESMRHSAPRNGFPAVNMSTVPISRASTGVGTSMPTPVGETTDTVAPLSMSTVAEQTILLIDKDTLGNTTSSSDGIYKELMQYGTVDDDIIDRLIKNCRLQTPDCTEVEIIHFLREKGTIVRAKDSRIYSPIGFLLTAVPKCFAGEAFRLYREEQARQREIQAIHEAARNAEVDEWRREQEAQLLDPAVSEEEKRFIRRCLGLQ
jgi:predicted transcriptional regulator